MENKNKKILIISIVVVVLLIILAILGATGIYNKRLSNEKKQNEDNNQSKIEEIDKQEVAELTEEEINEILSKYGELVSSKLTDYVKTNEIPTWEEFKKTLEIEDTSVNCDAVIDKENKIVQFSSCEIEGNSITTTYSVKFEIETKEEYKYKLDVYKVNESYLYYCEEKGIQTDDGICNILVLSIPTKTNDTKILAFDSNYLFILYRDGDELYIYEIANKSSQKIGLETNYKKYELYTNLNKEKIIGVIYCKSDYSCGYYNPIEDKKLYSNKTPGINFYPVSEDYISATVENGDGVSLLSTHEEKVLLTTGGYYFIAYGNDNNYLLCPTIFSDGSSTSIYCESLYDRDLNMVMYKTTVTPYDNALYFNEDNKMKKLSLNGNISVFRTCDNECWLDTDGYIIYNNKNNIMFENIKTGKFIDNGELNTYENYYGIDGKYLIYEFNNKIKVEDLETEKIYEIANFPDNYYYDSWWSGYYSKEVLNRSVDTKDKIEGLYIVLSYKGREENGKHIDKDENGNASIEYCLDNSGNIHTYEIKDNRNLGKAKPVLYLYPKKKTNVTVTFEKPELLTTTYPKFKDKWEVTAYPNGDLYDKSGKYYYALYWEEEFNNKVDFSTGFYVTKENALNFLEEKTEEIGLTRREANEFIMYWLPILEKNEKNLVYFELTKEVEMNNKLIITPKPDSILRMTIHVKKVDGYTKIKGQKLTTFKRKGFTVVEWGGVIY